MCGFRNMWSSVSVFFTVLFCVFVGVCMCGFRNVWVCVCVCVWVF